ncbi:MAG: cysteine hydrolase family protein [Candidatus Hermodarchaeota archaeon]
MPTNGKEKFLIILITMCLQNDFIENIPKLSKVELEKKYNHQVHVSYEECNKFWNEDKLAKFVKRAMEVGKQSRTSGDSTKTHQYYFIHLRDWHDDTDQGQFTELKKFGSHAIKGSYGAKFVQPLHKYITENRDFNLIVNSQSLNSFVDTDLEFHLKSILRKTGYSKDQVKIGIIGVITNIKILYLVYDLAVTYGYPHVYVCEDLCAGFDPAGHEQGIKLIKDTFFDVHIQKLEDFQKELKLIPKA